VFPRRESVHSQLHDGASDLIPPQRRYIKMLFSSRIRTLLVNPSIVRSLVRSSYRSLIIARHGDIYGAPGHELFIQQEKIDVVDPHSPADRILPQDLLHHSEAFLLLLVAFMTPDCSPQISLSLSSHPQRHKDLALHYGGAPIRVPAHDAMLLYG
jgi:hypothetical protein